MDLEPVLNVLLGCPLIGSQRAADMEMFWFGQFVERLNAKGIGYVVGEYRLHVECSWRITGPAGIVVGYTDLADTSDDRGEERSETSETMSLRDELLVAYYKNSERNVVAVESTRLGDLTLRLSDDTTLEVFPDAANPETEYWRLIEPGGTHYVMSGSGLTRLTSKS
jgi:hypothetical protein